jgi:DNA-binding MarR family transcriptional regulator
MAAFDASNIGKQASVQTAIDVLTGIGRVAHMSERVVSSVIPNGTTAAQYFVLQAIASRSELQTITQIAEILHVSQPTMSSTVRKLVRKRLVKLEPQATDKRAKHVRLTAAGKTLKEQCDEAVEPVLASITGALSDDHWASLRPAVRTLGSELATALSEPKAILTPSPAC